MTNILYFSNYATLTRGGQRSTWFILRELDKTKFSPVLLCQEEGDLTNNARAAGIPAEILRVSDFTALRFYKAVPYVIRIASIIQKYNIKIIHAEDLKVLFLAYFLKPFFNIKLIWHVRIRWELPIQRKFALVLCDAIICVSKAISLSFSGHRKVFVARNGINAGEYLPDGDKITDARIPEKGLLIGYLASLEKYKGPDVLIQAAPMVIAKHPDIKFLFIGNGPVEYVAYLKETVKKLNIENSVIFWGEEQKRLPLLMNRMDIFVLPSFSEGLSRSLMEAMCREKAIVASDIPENAEIIEHLKTGLLAKKGDPNDFAEKINYILDNWQSAQQMGKSARQYAAQNLTLAKTMEGIYTVYKYLLKT
jgi:glycosyltransferase involved in cell wall biosynthesis